MTSAKVAGTTGEQVAEWCLVRRGWKITGCQVTSDYTGS